MLIQPIAWTIAGSDSSGGAGIQADLKVFQQLGVHGCSVITALTAQQPKHISDIHYVSSKHVAAQLQAMQDCLPPVAVKIGMLGDETIFNAIVQFLQRYQGKLVLDPVMIASSGQALFKHNQEKYLKQFDQLFPYVDLFTPNVMEACALLNRSIQSYDDIQEAADLFIQKGVQTVLIKGGHVAQDVWSQDYWTNGKESCWVASSRYPDKNYRGTGCIFSAAITACLALGYELKDAIVIAKMYINRGIRLAQSVDAHTAYVMHAPWPEDEIDLPMISHIPLAKQALTFPSCGTSPIGLYPIIDTYAWIESLAQKNITTVQLRIKHKTGNELEEEIKKSIQQAAHYNIRLFINDYWELAIAYGAYGVHLGQGDIHQTNIHCLRQAGLRLGISTHCYYEVARAHAISPSYLACGPIFHTTSKTMLFPPQGIAQLQRWCRTLNNYRLVAIGGINENNIAEVWQAGVDGIAMISAIKQCT
ncbi:MAG: phosphomethylpyrimidine kinase [Gammaproteobacteria bacterium RIFCSPHIGHO2_12_FULL_37_34]|nr:MAG: phosphomethylpyrimidine kinase [Gammaproteobacteria bacterium RIFCSPHIGHO2_12_FULL_37_34]